MDVQRTRCSVPCDDSFSPCHARSHRLPVYVGDGSLCLQVLHVVLLHCVFALWMRVQELGHLVIGAHVQIGLFVLPFFALLRSCHVFCGNLRALPTPLSCVLA